MFPGEQLCPDLPVDIRPGLPLLPLPHFINNYRPHVMCGDGDLPLAARSQARITLRCASLGSGLKPFISLSL